MSVELALRTVASGFGITVDHSRVVSGTETVVIDDILADAASDVEYTIAFTLAQLVAIVMASDQTVLLETNSSSAPQESITLAAGVPRVFVTADGGTAPFAGSVTKIYLTNQSSGTATAHVQIIAMLDASP